MNITTISTQQIEQLCATQQTESTFYTNQHILKHYIQNEACASSIISTVNKLLSVGSSRDKGFEILNELLEHCTVSVLSENAVSWISIACGRHPKSPLKHIRLVVIEKLIRYCANIQEFKKAAITDHLSDVIEACLLTNPDLVQSKTAVSCLSTCFQKYPSACGPFKNKLEAFLLKFLARQSSFTDSVEEAARAFHFLQQIGGGGSDGVNHQNNWSNQLQKLCATIHNLCDTFLEGVTELGSYDDVSGVGFGFPDVPSTADGVEISHVYLSRLRNCLIFVAAMLGTRYPVPKAIPLQALLGILTRGLSIHTCVTNKSIEKDQFAQLLIEYQINLLHLLHMLIACVKQNLNPFGFTVNKLLVDCLSRTQKCACFTNNSEYQVTTYKVLKYWLRIGRNTFSSTFHEKLLELITADISSSEHKVLLQLNTTNKGKKSSKRKHELSANNSVLDAENESNFSEKFRENVCLQSLECLSELLNCVALNISLKATEELYEIVVKTLIDIQTGKLIQQYKNPECQALLLKVLVSFFEQPFLKTPPPLQLAINILNTAQITGKNEIPSICQTGLNTLEKLSQPVCKSLYVQRHYDHQPPKEQKDYFVPKFEQAKAKNESKKIRILSNIKLNDYLTNKPAETEKVTVNISDEESTEYEVESVKSSEDADGPVLTSVEIVEIEEEFEFVAKTESRTSDSAEIGGAKREEEEIVFDLDDEEEAVIAENGSRKDSSESVGPEGKSKDDDRGEEKAENVKGGKNGDGSVESEEKVNGNSEDSGENKNSEILEPPRKKIKEAEDVDEEDMMNSFVDVVNE